MYYINMLKSSGLKATTQRIGILKVIDEFGHISIDDIYHKIHDSLPNLSLATIYKNILMMVDRDTLVEVPIVGNKSKYEIKKENHIHLICEECGSVTDESIESIPQEPINTLIKKDEFTLTRSQINLYGICQGCTV